MALLRKECVYVSTEYLATANQSKYATLDPDHDGVQNYITTDNLVTDWFPIFANSFGPFDLIRYFESPMKILWLLKEPLIKKESWVKGDRGGHDQAKENYLWEEIKDNDTLKNLIKITSLTMSKILGSEYDHQAAMYQICILEVNHFSGLYFNNNNWESNDETLSKWTDFNQRLISTLIGFYDPAIIFFASTLELFDAEFGDFKDVQDRFNRNTLKIFGDNIVEWAYVYAEDKQEKDITVKKFPITDKTNIINVGRNIKYLGKSGRIYVQAYHPTYRDNAYIKQNKKDLVIGIDSKKIKEWMQM